MTTLQPPVTYQGGKQRLASQIIQHLNIGERSFFDLCCGSGAVSLAAVNAGVAPDQVTMVDAGPWGLFWEHVGWGTFDLTRFQHYLNDIPKDVSLIQTHVEALAKQPVDDDAAYVFLLLQAASFGGKAIWIKDKRWRNTSFRSYWLPTKTSNRRSPVNPMMPMPQELWRRVLLVVEKMQGVTGVQAEIQDIVLTDLARVVYIDPPYQGTTAYGYELDVVKEAGRLGGAWISEGRAFSDGAIKLASGRTKGGISAERTTPNEEWLSFVGGPNLVESMALTPKERDIIAALRSGHQVAQRPLFGHTKPLGDDRGQEIVNRHLLDDI